MAHRYWRILFPRSPAGGPGYDLVQGVCVVGVEMRASIGGGNAIGGGTASASSTGGSGSVSAANGFSAYSGTDRWQTQTSTAGHKNAYEAWLCYDFGSGNDIEIEEITIVGVAGSHGATNPARFVLQFSDNNVDWTSKYFWQTPSAWATDGTDVRVFNSLNAVDYSFINQGRLVSLINYPAKQVRATSLRISSLFRQITQQLRVTQLRVISLVRGRVANPRVRTWTFTLDGHDFYVLRLGDQETLVYDVSTEQWVNWDSAGLPFWRPNVGMSWIGGTPLAHDHGSNIVVGDDTFGLLWFLDPDQPFDENPDYLAPQQEIPFERVVTAQVPMRGREVLPCYAVFLTGDNYGLSANDFVPTVKLEYSDDAGKTYDDAGTLNVTLDTAEPCYEWLSLGQIGAPGRLFKITDNGVFARIDSMNMNDEEDGG